MNIQELRQSLKEKWLQYYRDNREWLVKFGVWVDCDGVRRPTSSFIIATISVLEPRLTRLMPLVVDLSSSPDQVITALGLNFSPDDVLEAALKAEVDKTTSRLLPSRKAPALAAITMTADGVDAFSSNRYMEDMIRQDMTKDNNATANLAIGQTSEKVVITSKSGEDATSIAPNKNSITEAINPLSIAETKASKAFRDDGVESPSPNPVDAPKQSITYQDEQCSGRQNHNDEEIWR